MTHRKPTYISASFDNSRSPNNSRYKPAENKRVVRLMVVRYVIITNKSRDSSTNASSYIIFGIEHLLPIRFYLLRLSIPPHSELRKLTGRALSASCLSADLNSLLSES